jgi:ABC-type antimicrobial peptide transport system permease subunit
MYVLHYFVNNPTKNNKPTGTQSLSYSPFSMLKNYFLVALRNVMRNRVYTLLNVLGLALGIACGLIIFWFIRFHTTYDAFHENQDRIYMVNSIFKSDGVYYNRGVPPHMSKAIRADIPEIVPSMCIERNNILMAILDKNGRIEKKFQKDSIGGAYVEADYFKIFTFPWKVGNPTSMKEPNKIALSEKLAKLFFNNENPIGRTIRMENEVNLEVVGIFYDIRENTELQHQYYISFQTLHANPKYEYGGPALKDSKGNENWGGVNSATYCFTLFPKNVSLASLKPRMEALTKKYHPDEYKTFVHELVYFRDVHFIEEYQNKVTPQYVFWTLASIGAFLILTACFNFINMATAQAMRRAKEVGVRKSVGSSNVQIFWQFMTETGIIVFFAVVLGLTLGSLVMPNLNGWLGTDGWESKVNWGDSALWIALAVGYLSVTFLAGTYPAMILAGFKPIVALKGSISTRQVGGLSLRRVLITFQFLLIQILLIGTLLLNKQMDFMLGADMGYNIKALYDFNFPRPDSVNQETFRQRALQIAGIEKITLRSAPPTSNWVNTTSLSYENRKEREKWGVSTKNADHHYIDTYGIKLSAGTNIPKSDTISGFLVSERVVERLGLASPQEVVGKYIEIWGTKAKVYGVMKNFHDGTLQREMMPTAVFSYKNNYGGAGVRLNTKNVKRTLTDLQKLWNEYFPNYVFQGGFLDEGIQKSYNSEQAIFTLIRTFSWIAIFIGCLGMYGLVRFLAVQKTKEIGVRKAYGATVGQILYLFGLEMVRLILIGFVIALPTSYFLMRLWLKNYFYRIDLNQHIWFSAGVALFITTAVALLTIVYESYKAATQNPSLSLKTE